jgi:hypothetical protein
MLEPCLKRTKNPSPNWKSAAAGFWLPQRLDFDDKWMGPGWVMIGTSTGNSRFFSTSNWRLGIGGWFRHLEAMILFGKMVTQLVSTLAMGQFIWIPGDAEPGRRRIFGVSKWQWVKCVPNQWASFFSGHDWHDYYAWLAHRLWPTIKGKRALNKCSGGTGSLTWT